MKEIGFTQGKCDICGKTYKDNSEIVGVIFVFKDTEKDYQICDVCFDKLKSEIDKLKDK